MTVQNSESDTGASTQEIPVVAAPVRRSRPELTENAAVARIALLIVGGLLLGFAFNLVLLSPLRANHDQHGAYADFRSQLANAIAPTAPRSTDGVPVAVGAPIALLQSPDTGMDLVVFNGTSSTVLISGPGYQRDTVMPGQVGHTIIMGRANAYGGPFSGLAAMPIGTKLVVTTGQGESTYEVTAIRRSGAPITRLQPGEGRLTLATADGLPFMPSGLVEVDAKLTSTPADAQGALIASALLNPAEQVLAGDSGAAIGLVLWSALLLIAAVVLVWLSIVWGKWQSWVVAVPVVTALGVAVSNHIMMLLPNLI